MTTTKDTLTAGQKITLKATVKTPRSAQVIAEKAGYPPNGKHVGRTLSRLREAGLVERTSDGLWRRCG